MATPACNWNAEDRRATRPHLLTEEFAGVGNVWRRMANVQPNWSGPAVHRLASPPRHGLVFDVNSHVKQGVIPILMMFAAPLAI